MPRLTKLTTCTAAIFLVLYAGTTARAASIGIRSSGFSTNNNVAGLPPMIPITFQSFANGVNLNTDTPSLAELGITNFSAINDIAFSFANQSPSPLTVTFYDGTDPNNPINLGSTVLMYSGFSAGTASGTFGNSLFTPERFPVIFSSFSPNLVLVFSASGFGFTALVTISSPHASITAPVPEPATLVLLGTGLAGVGAAARRRSARNTKSE